MSRKQHLVGANTERSNEEQGEKIKSHGQAPKEKDTAVEAAAVSTG